MALAEKIHEGLKKHMAKSKEKEEKKSSKGGKHHFRVEQMDDGTFSVHHRVIGHGKREYEEPMEEESSTHKNMNAVAKHMKACCGEGTEESGVVAGVAPKKGKLETDEED